jgi:5-(carboxyamino)imidazole ribonucleotide synthase
MGSTNVIQPSLMLNLVGEPGHSGTVKYQGLAEALKIEGAYIHLYGKHETKPGRKMGHVTILGKDKTDLLQKADFIKNTLKVIAE